MLRVCPRSSPIHWRVTARRVLDVPHRDKRRTLGPHPEVDPAASPALQRWGSATACPALSHDQMRPSSPPLLSRAPAHGLEATVYGAGRLWIVAQLDHARAPVLVVPAPHPDSANRPEPGRDGADVERTSRVAPVRASGWRPPASPNVRQRHWNRMPHRFSSAHRSSRTAPGSRVAARIRHRLVRARAQRGPQPRRAGLEDPDRNVSRPRRVVSPG